MCTVFAESEVTSLIAKGNNRREIARGLHASVIRRAAGMINRVSSEGDIVFTGGVAQNPCMVAFLAEKLGAKVLIPENRNSSARSERHCWHRNLKAPRSNENDGMVIQALPMDPGRHIHLCRQHKTA
jgi:hypothetical protein